MVKTIPKEIQYFNVKDQDLETLLRGEIQSRLKPSSLFDCEKDLKNGETGILVATGKSPGEPSKPLALICHEQDVRRLCGRFAHVRSDFAPLTTWCHLLKPEFCKHIEGILHQPRFNDTLAAWCGVVVAETILLSGRRIADIGISTCLASSTFAIARAISLWPRLAVSEILDRFILSRDTSGKLSIPKYEQEYAQRVRSAFDPLWSCLIAMMDNSNEHRAGDLSQNIEALQVLESARRSGNSDEAGEFVVPLSKYVQEVEVFDKFSELVPEARLEVFDDLVDKFKKTEAKDSRRRNGLAMVCGYLTTKVAGGSPSLSLVHRLGFEAPELIGWTYLLGGIGEPITWSSGFDGLGRLIARELDRPFRLDESPTCDYALDEAKVLLDDELKDPLVHLKIKQSTEHCLSVALFPGVNIAIPSVEGRRNEDAKYKNKRDMSATSTVGTKGDLVPVLADHLWPNLRKRVIEEIRRQSTRKTQRDERYAKRRPKSTASKQDELPLEERED